MATQADLDRRPRNEHGEISREHGNTLLRTLRALYGPAFASGFADTDTLDNVLTGAPNHASLTQLLADHSKGDLPGKLTS